MKFCPECESLLMYSEENGKLMNKCRVCGYTNETDEVLIQTRKYKNISVGSDFVNRRNYIYDPTLARTIHYNCPNKQCGTKKNEDKKEAVFFNEINSLKQVYICTVCNMEWKY